MPEPLPALHPVTCRRCATTVGVAKNSLAQTSIQWSGDAGAQCTELAEHRAAGRRTALVPVCEALRASIEEAVREGSLSVSEP